jgi:hypothetical protein
VPRAYSRKPEHGNQFILANNLAWIQEAPHMRKRVIGPVHQAISREIGGGMVATSLPLVEESPWRRWQGRSTRN